MLGYFFFRWFMSDPMTKLPSFDALEPSGSSAATLERARGLLSPSPPRVRGACSACGAGYERAPGSFHPDRCHSCARVAAGMPERDSYELAANRAVSERRAAEAAGAVRPPAAIAGRRRG